MADNVPITAGTGTTIAADEVVDGTLGTVKVQYVKLMDGALDGTTKAGVGPSGLKVDVGAWSVSSQTNLTTTATVSAAAGAFSGGSFINLNSSPVYLQFFDTTGTVTLGTTTPTFVQPIPANATAANGAAFVFHIPGGIALTSGLKVAATTTATGATAAATGLIGFITYK